MIGTVAILLTGVILLGQENQVLTGIVVRAGDEPVPGVTVWLSSGWTGVGTTPTRGKSVTDERGRFSMAVPADLPHSRVTPEWLSVWAHQPGKTPGRDHVGPISEGRREEIRLTLGPAQPRRLTLRRPNGKPLVGATVKPISMSPSDQAVLRYFLSVPDELGDLLASKSDGEGKVELSYLETSASALLSVTTADDGIHHLFTQPGSDGSVTLGAVGRVAGRVIADDPAVVRGVTIGLSTTADGKAGSGAAYVRTEDEGRFAVPALAEGALIYSVNLPDGSPYRPEQKSPSRVTAARENRLEITLRRAIPVHGTVRERGTNRPIAGAGVMIGGGYQGDIAYSGADGRYSSFLLPGPAGQTVFAWLAPRPFFPVSAGPYAALEIPANAREFELPTVELARGESLSGKVVDPEGHPVPGARVEGALVMQQGMPGSSIATTADAGGTFAFTSLDPSRTGLRLEASTPEARTERPYDVSPSVRTPVTLTVSPRNLVPLTGRVVDEAGRPVEGVEVELWSQEGDFADPAREPLDGASLRTGPDGSYGTPRSFRIDRRYRVKAGGRGLSRDWSEWVRFRPGEKSLLPDLVVGRARSLQGQIADRQGKPVPGARVSVVSDDESRPVTTADEQGRFRLECPPARGAAFLFAGASGFRFAGRLIGPADTSVNVEMIRMGEPIRAAREAIPPGLDADERRRMALKLLEPEIEKLRAGPVGVSEYHTFQFLARINPILALELAEKARFVEPMMREGVRDAVARRMLREEPDEAIELFESLNEPIGRTNGYRLASDLLPATERDRKRAMLSQGFVHARAIKDPALRLIFEGQIAGRLLELGDTDRATKILRDGQAVARELAPSALSGYGRGAFAEDLARIDLPAALELTKGLTDEQEFDRHHGNIAQRIAAGRPADAERVWEMMKRPIMRDGYAVRVCYAMAPKDRERARRIAEKIADPYTKGYALGRMAQALAASDKAAAARMLDDALAWLETVSRGKETYVNSQSAAATAATLLEAVQAVDPSRVPEFVWRSLSLRGPRRENEREEVSRLATDAVHAVLVFPHDPAVAKALLRPVLDRLPRLISGGVSYFPDAVFAAPAALEPREAFALTEGLPAEKDPLRRQGWTPQRVLVARVLTASSGDLDRMTQQITGFWDADGYDLAGDE
jgi:protocatechuate 3,4-dioxygenase beta subunit